VHLEPKLIFEVSKGIFKKEHRKLNIRMIVPKDIYKGAILSIYYK